MSTGDDYGVTPLQRETLTEAVRMGYYEVPREATLEDLSEAFDVSRQAISERLSRGVAGLVEHTLLQDS
jgi:predicted DNA binding protein